MDILAEYDLYTMINLKNLKQPNLKSHRFPIILSHVKAAHESKNQNTCKPCMLFSCRSHLPIKYDSISFVIKMNNFDSTPN
jgi:hypothetical protein